MQAAVTYENNVALLNAVYPGCISTGGSSLIDRNELRHRADAGAIATKARPNMRSEYWADFRSVETVTLEELMERHEFHYIDILKLDCEGSEFSILRHTRSLDRIGLIIGEYHGKEAFHELVSERFSGWPLRILRDGDLGTFWLTNPRASVEPAARHLNGVAGMPAGANKGTA